MPLKVADPSYVAAIESVYWAAAAPDNWPVALQAIADCFGDVGAILIYRRDDGTAGTLVSPEMAASQAAYEKDWWRLDIGYTRAIERGYLSSKDTLTDRDWATESEIAEHPFYTEFLAGQGLRWRGAVSISPDPRVAAAVSVQRASDKPPFSEAELLLLSHIGRHVENALRIGIRLLEAEMATLTLGDALSRVEIGVFLLDFGGRVTFVNAAGRMLLGDSLVLRDNRLSASVAIGRDALRAAIAGVVGENANIAEAGTRPLVVQGSDGRPSVAVHVLPVGQPSTHPVDRLLAGTGAILLARVLEAGAPTDPALLRDLFGLTLGEARVAALVGSGIAPNAAAGRLGISGETARTTLKHVFAKLGVSRQGELVALLARLPVPG